jgi:hypothetical protein
MKLRRISALMLLVVISCPWVMGQDNLQNKTLTFDKAAFEQSLINTVGPKVMGYQFVLIKDGKIVSDKAEGLARSPKDGSKTMLTTSQINFGSLMKFMSGTAFLNLLEKPPLQAWNHYKQSTMKANLEKEIWTEFPKLWLDQIPAPNVPGPTVRSIEFRQVLQHRSGFDNEWNKDKIGGRPLLGFLKYGFNAAEYNVRDYCNVNFVLTGHFIPLIEKKIMKSDLDLETGSMSTAEAEKYIRTKLGNRMDAVMRERIWNKMTPKIAPSCDGTNALKDTAAYQYSSKNDTSGVLSSSFETNGHCVGEGGYWLSAHDFANYIAHFSTTDLIVSKSVRDMMYNDTMKADDRMVWSSATTDNWIKANFGMPYVAWSDGRSQNGSGGVLLRLPQNYYLVIFDNSPDMDGGDLFWAGTAAFKAGMQKNF